MIAMIVDGDTCPQHNEAAARINGVRICGTCVVEANANKGDLTATICERDDLRARRDELESENAALRARLKETDGDYDEGFVHGHRAGKAEARAAMVGKV